MNHCDHDHETKGEIRRLPIGKEPHHGAVLVCQKHFYTEMAYRHERAAQTGRDKWEFPSWDSLEVYVEALAK